MDDLASQVQMLEQSKAKLEMSMTALKKEHRRELGMKDDELEDARQVWPLDQFLFQFASNIIDSPLFEEDIVPFCSFQQLPSLSLELILDWWL